jgi:hypothetical protein
MPSGEEASRAGARPAWTVVAWVLGALGLVVAYASVGMGSYALSSDPDTARSTLVTSAVELIVVASALLALAGRLLRSTAPMRPLTRAWRVVGAIAITGLVLVLLMVWVTANTWDNPHSVYWASALAGGFALAASLLALAIRQALLPIALALALGGALAAVASTLQP